MLLSQVIRGAAITGRTDAVGTRLLGRQGGRWAQQWIDSAFPDAAARSHGAPPPPDARATLRVLEDLRSRGLLTDDEFERLRRARG
jgi:Short C-terminal domain